MSSTIEPAAAARADRTSAAASSEASEVPVFLDARAVGDDGPIRLSLSRSSIGGDPSTPGPGPLDGAWWPRSRDLARELPALTDALGPVWGRITHITVNPTHWPVVPKKVAVPGRTVRVGWFAAEQDPHKLLLLSSRLGRWDLLIVPPQTPPATAARLMAAAADPGNRRTASALMTWADTDADPLDAATAEAAA